MLKDAGIELPIIQAPMAGVATPALAAAVSNVGALGSLGIGASSLEQARAAIFETQALTKRPFNVNVFCHEPAHRNDPIETKWIEFLSPLFAELGASAPSHAKEIYKSFVGDEETYRLLLDLRPAFVSFHFGLPDVAWIAAMRDAGIRTLATATNLQEARAIEDAGVDAVIAQGIEAGGHRGIFDQQGEDERHSTLVLVRLLVKDLRIPVIAAGGIMDGHAIRAMVNIGACAAQLGTAFIVCPESAADAAYRSNFESGRAEKTALTEVFSGRKARAIVNRFVDYCRVNQAPEPAPYPVAYDVQKQLHSIAKEQGIYEFAAHWAGQGAPMARPLPAAELVALLMKEFRAR